uniref:ERCC4 domain-containing protein n=1 Tax=viral metagenome TaxID=1070528 RepID=A0A6C0B7V4_9ZZZZ
MRVILDERERDLYLACQSIVESNQTYVKLTKEVLPLGDVYVKTDEEKDVLIIERKTIADLLASIKDGRYGEQSYRLIHSSGFPCHSVIYIIEGSISQLRTTMERKIVYSALASLNYFKGFSVIRTGSIAETAEYIVWMCDKIERNFLKGEFPYYLQAVREPSISNEDEHQNVLRQSDTAPANYCTVVKKVKKENVTPENIGEIVLCQIPGISSTSAIAIMQKFGTFPQLLKALQENPNCLDDIGYESKGKFRKINKPCIDNIKKYFL